MQKINSLYSFVDCNFQTHYIRNINLFLVHLILYLSSFYFSSIFLSTPLPHTHLPFIHLSSSYSIILFSVHAHLFFPFLPTSPFRFCTHLSSSSIFSTSVRLCVRCLKRANVCFFIFYCKRFLQLLQISILGLLSV